MVEATPKDYGLAFGLVIAAGCSTALGASTVFFANHANHRVLAACLAVSAGVMLYVSFVEIFAAKAISGFEEAGFTRAESTRYGTLCFFGGMLVLWMLDKVVHGVLHIARKMHNKMDSTRQQPQLSAVTALTPTTTRDVTTPEPESSQHSSSMDVPVTVAHASESCCVAGQSGAHHRNVRSGVPSSSRASGDMRRDDDANVNIQVDPEIGVAMKKVVTTATESSEPGPGCMTSSDGAVGNHHHHHGHRGGAQAHEPIAHEAVETILEADAQDKDSKGLSRMGLLAALAIGLHNLPEGLATFVGALADPTAGVVIAIAIALHNIPEGIVVSMPIFYATGSRWKGFLWGCLSGGTEPIGALIGYAIIRGSGVDPMVYALLFGLVSGMMVYISIAELLPTALQYDPDDTVVTKAVVVGMSVMAASLLLFEAA